MLVLSRQRDQSTVFDFTQATDEDISDLRSGKTLIEAVCVDIRGDKVRTGFNAPKSVQVHRKEIWDTVQREKRAAAAKSRATPANI